MPDSEKIISEKLLLVTIESLAFGGYGVARHDSLVIFIPFAAPTDVLKIKITEHKKNHAWGEIVEIVKPSDWRTTPECQHFEACGGCQWQHISYDKQLVAKQEIVEKTLSKSLKTEIKSLPIIASPLEWNYRNRIQIKNQDGKMGFHRRKSHDLIELFECHITDENVWNYFSRNKLELQKLGQNFEVFITENNEIKHKTFDKQIDDLAFSQVNNTVNELLKFFVFSAIAEFKFETLMDLYAGHGNFTFPMYDMFKVPVVGVELAPKAVEAALQKARSLNLSPKFFDFYLSDVKTFLKKHLFKNSHVVVLDPPRSGCEVEVLQYLGQNSHVNGMIYISCDPNSLARDLKILLDLGQFKIRHLQTFDMFPQTYHVETVVVLEKLN